MKKIIIMVWLSFTCTHQLTYTHNATVFEYETREKKQSTQACIRYVELKGYPYLKQCIIECVNNQHYETAEALLAIVKQYFFLNTDHRILLTHTAQKELIDATVLCALYQDLKNNIDINNTEQINRIRSRIQKL